MGGAIALLVHRRQPDSWDGAVLLAPMCKVLLCVVNMDESQSTLNSNVACQGIR